MDRLHLATECGFIIRHCELRIRLQLPTYRTETNVVLEDNLTSSHEEYLFFQAIDLRSIPDRISSH